MPSAEEPSPIPLRAASHALDRASEERLALALTLMTKFSLDRAAADRAATASGIAGALHAIADGPELTPELRRLCARLQRIWAAVPLQQEPM